LIVPVPFHQRAARLKAIPHTSFLFPVMRPADLQQSTVRLTARRWLSRCRISAVLLLGSVCVTHAQQDAARPAGALAQTDLTAGFVETASQRFAVPAPWIRAVLQAESGGVVHAVSPTGAMGLMQIMPETWIELRSRYGLGSDPYDPHDNIIAGTAYLRELLDRYGEGGFLAAYNAGPGRYEEHLATGKPLPSETLAYISAITSLPGSASLDGANSAASWTSSSLFVAKASAVFTSHQPPADKPEDRRSTNGFVPTATAYAPHSDGLFARKSDRTARP
jgi:soluble lytic murein transglycosylase-like protein